MKSYEELERENSDLRWRVACLEEELKQSTRNEEQLKDMLIKTLMRQEENSKPVNPYNFKPCGQAYN